MRRCLLTAGLMLTALFAVAGSVRAADAPYVGTWKVLVSEGTPEFSLFILKIEEKADGPKIEVVDTIPNYKKAKLEVEKAGDAPKLKFACTGGQIPMTFTFYPPKGEKEPKTILGCYTKWGNVDIARLERTEDKAITPFKMNDDYVDYRKALHGPSVQEMEAGLNDFISKNAKSVFAYPAALRLIELVLTRAALFQEVPDKEVKALAERAIDLAAPYGPEMKAEAVKTVSTRLAKAKASAIRSFLNEGAKDADIRAATQRAVELGGRFSPEARTNAWSIVVLEFLYSQKVTELAVEFASLAEKELPRDATTQQRMDAAKRLLAALKRVKKTEEIPSVTERIAKLDKILDEEYVKTAVPFATRAFQREGKSDRVVLVELFTSAQLPYAAADIAFDAALKTYQPKDVVLLQYHLVGKKYDALANADTKKRLTYFYPVGNSSYPSAFVNGGENIPLSGPNEEGKNSFERLAAALKSQLGEESRGKIKLTAKRSGTDGEDILINVEVAKGKDAGDEVKLRLALVEEVVHYPGISGRRFHHQVVRGMPGGVEGFEVKGGMHKQEVKVNVRDLRKALTDDAEEESKIPEYVGDGLPLPLDLKHLKVVAFVQNDKTKEVLQAAQVDVGAAK